MSQPTASKFWKQKWDLLNSLDLWNNHQTKNFLQRDFFATLFFPCGAALPDMQLRLGCAVLQQQRHDQGWAKTRCFRGHRSEAQKPEKTCFLLKEEFLLTVHFQLFSCCEILVLKDGWLWDMGDFEEIGEIVSYCFHCLAGVCYWLLASQKVVFGFVSGLHVVASCFNTATVLVEVKGVKPSSIQAGGNFSSRPKRHHWKAWQVRFRNVSRLE